MKMLRLLVALFAMIFGSSYAQALDPPAHTGWVVDNAYLFSPADRRALARELSAIQKAGGGRGVGPQVEVLTITSLQGDDVKDFAIRTARTWKLGAKGHKAHRKIDTIDYVYRPGPSHLRPKEPRIGKNNNMSQFIALQKDAYRVSH